MTAQDWDINPAMPQPEVPLHHSDLGQYSVCIRLGKLISVFPPSPVRCLPWARRLISLHTPFPTGAFVYSVYVTLLELTSIPCQAYSPILGRGRSQRLEEQLPSLVWQSFHQKDLPLAQMSHDVQLRISSPRYSSARPCTHHLQILLRLWPILWGPGPLRGRDIIHIQQHSGQRNAPNQKVLSWLLQLFPRPCQKYYASFLAPIRHSF